MPIWVVDVPDGRWFGGLLIGKSLLSHEHGGLEPVCARSPRSECRGKCAVGMRVRETDLVHGVLWMADNMSEELKLHGRDCLRQDGDGRGYLGCFFGDLKIRQAGGKYELSGKA